MGVYFDFYLYNKNATNVEKIKERKNENKDFHQICAIIESCPSSDKSKIPNIFKFLNINYFYLGLSNMEKIYYRYENEFKSRNLGLKDSVHASLLFTFENDCNYFIDYFPETWNFGYLPFYQEEKKGVRYKPMTIEEFICNNSVCIIKMKSNKKITLYDLFKTIYFENNWKYENYDLEKHNCCHFARFILKKLDADLLTGNKIEDILFTKFIEKEQKEEYIYSDIPNIFLTIFN